MVRTSMIGSVMSAALIAAAGCAGDGESTARNGDPSVPSAAATAPAVAMYGRECATPDLDEGTRAAIDADLAARVASFKSRSGLDPTAPLTATATAALGGPIPVYVHVVTSTTGGGDVTSQMITGQVDVLNAAYAEAGFTFALAGTTRDVNDAWYTATPGSTAERQMKLARRQGGAGALNLYTGVNDGALLGWATFPSSYHARPADDGVVVLWASLPGGGAGGSTPNEPDGFLTYDGGDTGTHEVGHWLGLYHTFQGGCSNKNDAVADTEAEADPQFYCAERDSCTGRKYPGVDPIHNFMDYVDDDCMDHFTAGQNDRMNDAFAAYRM